MNENLIKIFEICTRNGIDFNYKSKPGKDNIFSLDKKNKMLVMEIGKPEELNDKLIELKKLLNE